MAYDPQQRMPSNTSEPSEFYVPVTPGGTALAGGLCRAIVCNEAGALNLTDASGAVRQNIPVQAGLNPFRASVINAPSSGSAPSVVVALY